MDRCPEIKDSFRPGLSALGAHSSDVKAKDTSRLDGSVDIDSAVRKVRPGEARWDYAVGYAEDAYFVEVHPANTKNVDEMVKKVTWLKNWLATVAVDLKKLHKCGTYHWIPSGSVKILKTSKQYKMIAANNLMITNTLRLD